MESTWFLAATWPALALAATLLAIWLGISTALSEIVVGTVAQLLIGAFLGSEALGVKAPWIGFLSGTGAIVLTFLAGAELDPRVFRAKWKEASAVGLVGFCSLPGLRRRGAIRSRMVYRAELAGGGRAVHHVSRRRLCGDARARIQPNGVR
jgi:Kef-type K+ transport system membrane component KefB